MKSQKKKSQDHVEPKKVSDSSFEQAKQKKVRDKWKKVKFQKDHKILLTKTKKEKEKNIIKKK